MKLTLDELKNKDDIVEESEEVKIVYSSDIKEYVNNSVVDYSNIWFERGFVLKGAGASSC